MMATLGGRMLVMVQPMWSVALTGAAHGAYGPSPLELGQPWSSINTDFEKLILLSPLPLPPSHLKAENSFISISKANPGTSTSSNAPRQEPRKQTPFQLFCCFFIPCITNATDYLVHLE